MGPLALDALTENIVLEGERFFTTANQGGNSRMSFRQASWKIEDGALYVTLYSGPVYGDYCGDRLSVDIQGGGLSEVRQVCPRDGSSAKLIYMK